MTREPPPSSSSSNCQHRWPGPRTDAARELDPSSCSGTVCFEWRNGRTDGAAGKVLKRSRVSVDRRRRLRQRRGGHTWTGKAGAKCEGTYAHSLPEKRIITSGEKCTTSPAPAGYKFRVEAMNAGIKSIIALPCGHQVEFKSSCKSWKKLRRRK